MTATFPVPASWPKSKREAAFAGRLPHIKPPDGDNVLKNIDALNEVVWVDDKQIVRAARVQALRRSAAPAHRDRRGGVVRIITADQRLSEQRGAKILVVGPTGVGKTSLLRTLDPERTLFLDSEAGDLSVLDVAADTIRVDDWPAARDLACRIGGPNPSYSPARCYSDAHFSAIGGAFDLSKYQTVFVDSVPALSRLSFRWAEQQPGSRSRVTGKRDLRGGYGLHAREMIAWLNQLRRARGMSVIFAGILGRKVVDDLKISTWQLQMEGSKTSRELPGIVDQIVTMQWIDFGDGVPVRAFICTSPNRWGFPAKDRSGRLRADREAAPR